MNEALESRLYNFKFDQALQYLDGEDQPTRDLVEALAAMYGNPGDFYGHQSTVIVAALRSIGVTAFDDEGAPEPNALAKALVDAVTEPTDPVQPTAINRTALGMIVGEFDDPAPAWVLHHDLGSTVLVDALDGERRPIMPSFALYPDRVVAWFSEPTTGRLRVRP